MLTPTSVWPAARVPRDVMTVDPTFSLFVKTPNNKTVSVTAQPSDTVAFVCEFALGRSGCTWLDCGQVYIYAGGHMLAPSDTVAQAGLQSLSTLRLCPNRSAINARRHPWDSQLSLLSLLRDILMQHSMGGSCSIALCKGAEQFALALEVVFAALEPFTQSSCDCLRALAGVQVLPALAAAAMTASEGCDEASKEVTKFAQRWLQRCLAAVRRAYEVAVIQDPLRLVDVGTCLSVLLSGLVPLLLRHAWGASWALAMLRDVLARTTFQGVPPPNENEALIAAALFKSLDECIVQLLGKAVSDLDAAFAGQNASMLVVRLQRCRHRRLLDAIQVLVDLTAKHCAAAPDGAIQQRQFGAVVSAFQHLSARMPRVLDKIQQAVEAAAADNEAAAIAASSLALSTVVPHAAGWLVGMLGCIAQGVPDTQSIVDLLSHPAMQAALQDPEGCAALQFSLLQCEEVNDYIPRAVKLWHMRSYAAAHADSNSSDGEPEVLVVQRSEIVESSYAELLPVPPARLSSGLQVRFAHEHGYGAGVTREWLGLLAARLFSPELGLFTRCGGNPLAVLPSPDAAIQPNHLEYFRVAGRVMGLALLHGVPLGFHLASAFYLGLRERCGDLGLQDMEEFDPQLARSFRAVLDADDAASMTLTFSITDVSLGKAVAVSLADDPSMPVHNGNREEYIAAAVQHRLHSRIRQEVEAFRKGLQDVLKVCPTSLFSHRALNEELAGEAARTICAEAWRLHTRCMGWQGWRGAAGGGEASEEPQVLRWFWMLVGALHQEQRRALLRFWTSLPCLPAGGFALLPRQLAIVRADYSTQRFPQAHTCFWQLVLPDYPDVLSLAAGLAEAVAQPEGFGMA